MTDLRAQFEAFISSPPYEREIDRFEDNDTTAWPGSYKDIAVELAWDAFSRGVSLERQACANVCHELALRFGNAAEGAGEPEFTISISSEAAAHHCEKGILGRKP